jgi:CheY-like chemotaxis protein
MNDPVKNILLVEDDPNDVFFLQRSLESTGYRGGLSVCADGEDAINYIFGCNEYVDRTRHPFPQLILSDWQMPRAGGKELLKWLREHPAYMVVPVIILSSSAESRDVKDAYCAGATAYIVKPPTQEMLGYIIRDFIQFWDHVLKPRLDIHTPCDAPRVPASHL